MNKNRAYMTIDDSPSLHTDRMTNFLLENNIPALFFCRGVFMDKNPDPLVRAVEKGFLLGNHTYAHRASGDLSAEEIIAEIEKTEKLIEDAYRRADRARPGKYFRFPYCDKGDGVKLEQRFDDIIDAVKNGSPPDLRLSSPAPEKIAAVQYYLRQEGFTQPFPRVRHPLYGAPAFAEDADCMMTFSTFDWMMLPRHLGRHLYKNVADLRARIDVDPFLNDPANVHIILGHDYDETFDVFVALTRHFVDKGFAFLPFD